jgi:hypothetical protein
MSVERAFLVRLRANHHGLAALLADISAAERRIPKALPGDRVDVIRYEALSTQLETMARIRLKRGDDGVIEIPAIDREGPNVVDAASMGHLPGISSEVAAWNAAGDVAIEVRTALSRGPTPAPPTAGDDLREPAAVWNAPVDERGRPLTGTRAVAERFKQQLRDAVNEVRDAAMLPSGVSNRALTDGLRAFVGDDSGPRRDVPVQYRDGSKAPLFPLRCLQLGDRVPEGWRTYHFAMLSIRHTEMDVEVDGAWLRNTDISRPRPAGDTDRIAYDLSTKQFDTLCASDPVLIYLYQTGLDTAVVGFYRAVTERLVRAPHSLAVVPMYFRRQPPSEDGRTVAGYQQQSTFEEGQPWVVETQL